MHDIKVTDWNNGGYFQAGVFTFDKLNFHVIYNAVVFLAP